MEPSLMSDMLLCHKTQGHSPSYLGYALAPLGYRFAPQDFQDYPLGDIYHTQVHH